MTRAATLGLDLGTSSLKAMVLDDERRPMAVASAGYTLASPRPDWSETDAHEWWGAVTAATRRALETAGRPDIAAVGLCGHMHGHVLVDDELEPVRPAVLWSDDRAAAMDTRFAALSADQRLRLANPFMPGAAGATLPWLAEHEPDVYAKARWSLQPKDWVRTRLVAGPPASDPSDASATLLWDVPADRWADDVVADLGIRRELLPPIRISASVAGPLTEAAATALGLDAGIPVACGSADAPAAAVGTGLVRPGRVQLTVGTGAQAFLLRTDPLVDATGRTHLYRSAIEGQWYAMAAVQNSGLALDWVRRALGVDWPALFAAVRTDAPRADDPIFLPNLTRERPHQAHPGPGAAFADVRLHHTSADLLRAATEGVALGIRLALEALPGAGGADPLLLAGGGGLDPGYRQLLADVVGRDLVSVGVEAASARGAALIAGAACGRWRSVEEAGTDEEAPTGPLTRWRPDVHRAYGPRFERFTEVAQGVDEGRYHRRGTAAPPDVRAADRAGLAG